MKNKILVIEDDRAISELLCMNLTIAGYETVAAYDGIEAQRLLLWLGSYIIIRKLLCHLRLPGFCFSFGDYLE